MRSQLRPPPVVLVLALATGAGACERWPDPPPVDVSTLQAEHAEWRAERRASLVTPPGGPVLWSGLWEIPEGETAFGSDPDLPITLVGEAIAARLGTLHRAGSVVELRPAPDAGIHLHRAGPITAPRSLAHDRSEAPTRLRVGTTGLRVHAEPGTDRLWLRSWDEATPERESFELPPSFPVDPSWRVTARFDPYEEAVPLRLPDVTGGMVEYQARGELVFRRGRAEHRLVATAGESSSSLFVLMWDSTAVSSTYQGGRYLRVPFPDERGWTTIDFNRTYNAPCVFTSHSVCALPPRSNWLPLAVPAGEMRPSRTDGLAGCDALRRGGMAGAPSGPDRPEGVGTGTNC